MLYVKRLFYINVLINNVICYLYRGSRGHQLQKYIVNKLLMSKLTEQVKDIKGLFKVSPAIQNPTLSRFTS